MAKRRTLGGWLRLGQRAGSDEHRARDISLEEAASMAPSWGRWEVRQPEREVQLIISPGRPAGWLE
ncbi:MAG: hypothetical protein M3281_01475 [Chloroflexota bacterium]|nr:hypothetical protein [Chloroflexota bacterium]